MNNVIPTYARESVMEMLSGCAKCSRENAHESQKAGLDEAENYFTSLADMLEALSESTKVAGFYGTYELGRDVFPAVAHIVRTAIDAVQSTIYVSGEYQKVVEKVLSAHGIDMAEFDEACKQNVVLADVAETRAELARDWASE